MFDSITKWLQKVSSLMFGRIQNTPLHMFNSLLHEFYETYI